MRFRFDCVMLLMALLTAFPAASRSQTVTSTCLACHGQPGFVDEKGHSLSIDAGKFNSSVHAALGCQACHSDIVGFPHQLPVKKVACADCHASEGSKFHVSVHRAVMENPGSPGCLNCHGNPHAIVPVHDPRSPTYPLNLPRTCGTCHGNPALAKQYGLPNVYSMYIDSIHGFAVTEDGLLVAATCSNCHGAHNILSPSDPRSRTYRSNVPSTCGTCHAGIKAKYLLGAHGRALRSGNAKAPVCTDCHTAHSIVNVRTTTWQLKTTARCGGCHAERLATYRDTFHGQVNALGFIVTARCWNCHRAHEILPSSDAQSSIAPTNLRTTCGKCHGVVSKSFVTYDPHANPFDRSHYPGLYYVRLFMNVLMLGVFGFFGLHVILWFIRSMIERNQGGPHAETAASREKV